MPGRDWKLRVYRAMWSNIRKHWTAERWIRVTDQEQAAQFVKINELQVDPTTGQPVIVNQIAALDVDIILDEAPDSITTMQDTFELLQSLAAAGAPVPPELAIELSGLPASTKTRILGKMEQAQQADPMAEQAKQLTLEVESSKAGLNKASAQDKIASAAQRWADIAQKPDEQANEQQGGDREFLQRREESDRDFSQRRQESERDFQGQRVDADRQFQGQDADRQAKIEDMRARQAAAQAAQAQRAQQQSMNGGGA